MFRQRMAISDSHNSQGDIWRSFASSALALGTTAGRGVRVPVENSRAFRPI
ncbi:hypothetical protein KCP73_20855 [Salmonella enterica subsp. enterica]|nr:hypothetical protein KCP73_20855 [Salmonella enterica subsp. enterica]